MENRNEWLFLAFFFLFSEFITNYLLSQSQTGNTIQDFPPFSPVTRSSSAGRGRSRRGWRRGRTKSRPGRSSARSRPLLRWYGAQRYRWRLLSWYTSLQDRGGSAHHEKTSTWEALSLPITWLGNVSTINKLNSNCTSSAEFELWCI